MTSAQLDFIHDNQQALMTDNLKGAVSALRAGRPILMLDAHDRENEGDLMVAGEKIDANSMNFLIKQGSGIVCLALAKSRLDELGLAPMIPNNTNMFQTAFTVSIEARRGVTTGVSAKDRAHTIQVAMADDAIPSDLARPGHVFPLAAKPQGVFERMGHTEGSVDLMKIAGLKPGAVLCELMNADGSMTVGAQRESFAQEHKIPMVSVEEVLFHRIRTENILEQDTNILADTRFGRLKWHRFSFCDQAHIDLFMREANPATPNSPSRLAIVSGEDQHKRFMANILQGSEDDPLALALAGLAQHNFDLVAMLSQPGRKLQAYLCRALLEASITNLSGRAEHEDFYALATNYFGIKYVR